MTGGDETTGRAAATATASPSATASATASETAEALLAAVTFDGAGLVPVIAQDRATGVVRMFAWANREALSRTLSSGEAHFWSRSRQAPWRKGESSGNTLHVRELRVDCDGDVVLYLVDAHGPSCHTGHTSCFFRATASGGARATSEAAAAPAAALGEDDGPAGPPAAVIARVAEVIARRRRERPGKSYVVSLLDGGFPKIAGKIREEAGELIEALPAGDAAHTAHEAADLLFHVLVGLEAAGVPVDAVFGELGRRFGVSGIDEKASRPRKSEPALPSAGAGSGNDGRGNDGVGNDSSDSGGGAGGGGRP